MPESRLAPRPDLPNRVTMPLLDLITRQAVDEDYLVAAERRAQAGTLSPTRHPQRRMAIVVAVFGVLATTAFVQTERNSSINDASRSTLIDRIGSERDRVSLLQDEVVSLREENARFEDLQRDIVTREQPLLRERQRLQVRTGFVAVTGDGVRVLVGDGPIDDPDATVRDDDLALLVDALWSAGAEAIAINGQRLTTVSAIQASGAAINVNGSGLTAPYAVLAIGDTRSLQADFFETSSGLQFDNLVRQFSLVFDMAQAEDLSLPAAPSKLLRLRTVIAGTAIDQDPPNSEENTP